jgi:hypothetical protein
MDVLRVRVADPESNRVTLWERHPAHPGGEVWLTGAGAFDVAATPAVVARLRDGRLVAVDPLPEEEQAAVAPSSPELERQQEADGRVLPAEEPSEDVSIVTRTTGGGAPRSRVNKRPAKGSL